MSGFEPPATERFDAPALPLSYISVSPDFGWRRAASMDRRHDGSFASRRTAGMGHLRFPPAVITLPISASWIPARPRLVPYNMTGSVAREPNVTTIEFPVRVELIFLIKTSIVNDLFLTHRQDSNLHWAAHFIYPLPCLGDRVSGRDSVCFCRKDT